VREVDDNLRLLGIGGHGGNNGCVTGELKNVNVDAMEVN